MESARFEKIRLSALKLISHEYFPLGLLITLFLIVGSLIVTDYGESWDEQLRYRYATNSLSAYLGDSKGLRGEKGSFYVMAAKLGSEAIMRVRKDWLPIESWHFMHFLSLLLGLSFFYIICLRLMNKWTAFSTTLLFGTQPLIWGHAFINPKDIPFMAFFLGSLATGLAMVDALTGHSLDEGNRGSGAKPGALSLHSILSRDWQALNRKRRGLFASWVGISVVILLGLIIVHAPVTQAMTGLIERAYFAEPSSALGKLFSNLAENMHAVPLENYVQKSLKLYPRLVLLYALLTMVVDLAIALRLFPTAAQAMWREHVIPFVKLVLKSLINKGVLGAGILLGLCTSTRVIGPAAGALVAYYFLIKTGRKAIPTLIAYFTIAVVVSYLTWPNLWGAPVENYIGSITQASDFPWDGKVMFAGVDYPVSELPRAYLPVLLSLQFTETAVILFLAGLAVAIARFIRRAVDRELVALLALWLILPIIAGLVLQPTMYDNFRHFLFVIPSIFLFAGLGIQAILDRIKSTPARIVILVLLLLPNLYWDVQLHPYQYVYYNSLTGGVRGAFRNYEMDYWATSYREAINYLNENAPANAQVVVWGPEHVVKSLARADLLIEKFDKENFQAKSGSSFAIVSSRHDKDLTLFPEAKQLYTVGRAGAIFAVVKQLDLAHPQNP
ncbi:MAG TPA: hypothetical protein VI755_06070 [Anaerolineales bacterium]|nr:hypothetical protein [Anaerolineales bacterium]